MTSEQEIIDAQTKLFIKADKMVQQVRNSPDMIQALIDMDVAFVQRVMELAIMVAEEEENYEQCHTLHTGLTTMLSVRDKAVEQLGTVG